MGVIEFMNGGRDYYSNGTPETFRRLPAISLHFYV